MYVQFKRTYAGPEGFFAADTIHDLPEDQLKRIGKKKYFKQVPPPHDAHRDEKAARRAEMRRRLEAELAIVSHCRRLYEQKRDQLQELAPAAAESQTAVDNAIAADNEARGAAKADADSTKVVRIRATALHDIALGRYQVARGTRDIARLDFEEHARKARQLAEQLGEELEIEALEPQETGNDSDSEDPKKDGQTKTKDDRKPKRQAVQPGKGKKKKRSK